MSAPPRSSLEREQSQQAGDSLRVVVFANLSQPPFGNNLMGPVKAFARGSQLLVIDPLRFPGVRPTGGAAPLPVPDEALAQAAAFTPQVVVCLGGGLVVLPEDRRRFLPEAVVVGIALSDPQALPTSLAIAPHFHLFYTQDFQCLSAYAAAGIAAGRFDLAADPEDFYHLPLDKRWDVVFVGKWTPYREKLLKALAQRVSVAIFTHEGESRWGLPTQGPLVTTQQLCLAFNQARMALDVAYVDESPAGLATYPPRITPRAFMAAACATPVLVEACASVEAFFLPGVEIATFSTLEEAVEVAGRLVGDERALVAMGKAARERVLRQHLWEGRVVQVLRQAYALWHSERAK